MKTYTVSDVSMETFSSIYVYLRKGSLKKTSATEIRLTNVFWFLIDWGDHDTNKYYEAHIFLRFKPKERKRYKSIKLQCIHTDIHTYINNNTWVALCNYSKFYHCSWYFQKIVLIFVIQLCRYYCAPQLRLRDYEKYFTSVPIFQFYQNRFGS